MHPLPSAAPGVAAAATAAGASCVGVAAGVLEADLNQVRAAGAEQYQLKDTSSVQEAALEVLRLCTTLQVSIWLSPAELHFIALSLQCKYRKLALHFKRAHGGSRSVAVRKNIWQSLHALEVIKGRV